jgi:hypothetical protein
MRTWIQFVCLALVALLAGFLLAAGALATRLLAPRSHTPATAVVG